MQQGVQEGQDQTGGSHHSPLHICSGSSGSNALLVALGDNSVFVKRTIWAGVSSSPSESDTVFLWKESHVIILRLVKSLNIIKLKLKVCGDMMALSFLSPAPNSSLHFFFPAPNSSLRPILPCAQFFPLPNCVHCVCTYIYLFQERSCVWQLKSGDIY